MSNICIVTPDLIGPIKNGGIGTHCYNLALLLVGQGHSVTALLTYPVPSAERKRWQDFYKKSGIALRYIAEQPAPAYPITLPGTLQISLRVFEMLRQERFDQIHFQDWQAGGFHCIQAKRTMGCFAETLLTVTAHSSTEWINEGMQQWNIPPADGTQIMWAERYCVTHCDRLISPSQAMHDWMRHHEWELPENYDLLPYVVLRDEPKAATCYEPEKGVFAFFGRLETRKGLKIFCEGLKKLPPEKAAAIRRIYFVGKEGICEGQQACGYIRKTLAAFESKVSIHNSLDSFEAQRFLREHKALAFLPSLLDNLPFSGLECVIKGIPAMVSNVGGFPEIFPAERLFEPTAAGVAAALSRALLGELTAAAPLYDAASAEMGWSELAELKAPAMPPLPELPFISVCMSHYNHGEYLPDALEALARQDYPSFEVIVIDDGSNDPASKKVFHHLRDTTDSRFRFFDKENEGLAKTRNLCAELAKGEYLVFCDADNVSVPNMLSTLAEAAARSGLDALTCHNLSFRENGQILGNHPVYRYAPMGADLVTGILQNTFGDANLIVKKTVFQEAGGFKDTRNSWEDWAFLIQLCLTGKSLDCIPEPLFWYRLTGTGMTSTTSSYGNHTMLLDVYGETLPLYARRIMRDLLVPLSLSGGGGTPHAYSVIINACLKLGIFLEKSYTRLCPPGSIQQRMTSRIWHALPKKNSTKQ